MKTTKTTNKVRASEAIQDSKHALLWLRGRAVSNRDPAAWIHRLKSLAMKPGHRHSAAGHTPQPPFAALHIVHRGEMAGIPLADHELMRCTSIRCKHCGDFAVETSGPTPCQSIKDLKHVVNRQFVALVTTTSLRVRHPSAG